MTFLFESPPRGETAPAPSAETAIRSAEGAALSSDVLAALDKGLADAAELGSAALQTAWLKLSKEQKVTLQAAKDRRHKPRAVEVDKANSNERG